VAETIPNERSSLGVMVCGLVTGIAHGGAKAAVTQNLCGQGKGGNVGEVLCSGIAAGVHVDGSVGGKMAAEDVQGMLGACAFGKQRVQMGGMVVVRGVTDGVKG